MHGAEKRVGKVEIAIFAAGEPELVAHTGEPALLKSGGKCGDRLIRKLNRSVSVRIQEWKKSLSESCKIPLRDLRLIPVGVAPQFIDCAKRLRRIVRIEEGAWPKVNSFS